MNFLENLFNRLLKRGNIATRFMRMTTETNDLNTGSY